jgi:hypothetical protein
MTVIRKKIISIQYSSAFQMIQNSVLWEGGFCCMIQRTAELQYRNLWSLLLFRQAVSFDPVLFKAQTSPIGGPLFPRLAASILGLGLEHSTVGTKRN